MTRSQPDLEDRTQLDDSVSGEVMFVIFTAAVLTVTGAVALLAVVGAAWVLALAFGIHVLMTILVMRVIFGAMDGGIVTALGRIRIRARVPETPALPLPEPLAVR